jgi:CheY-like chemotaxis protein
LDELRQAGYDAVLLRVERPDQLSLVLRVRSAAPDIPVIAVVPDQDADLGARARDSGADDVLSGEIQRSRAAVVRSKELRKRTVELAARARALLAKSFDPAVIPREHLRTLVVEDDADYGVLLGRTFRGLNLPSPVEQVRNGAEAIAYLSGRGKYRDRSKYPDATLVLLDLHLPRKSGFEVLQWIRSRPGLSSLIVFILTSSALREDFDRAMNLGADSYFLKPMALDKLRDVLGVAATRWGHLYKGLHS